MLIDNVTGQLIRPAEQLDANGLEAAVTLNSQVTVVDNGQAMDAAEADRTAGIAAAEQDGVATWGLWRMPPDMQGRNRIYRNKHDDTIRTTVALVLFVSCAKHSG